MFSGRPFVILLFVAVLAGCVCQIKCSEKYQDKDGEGKKSSDDQGHTYEEEGDVRKRYQPGHQRKGKNPPMPKTAKSILNENKPGAEYKLVSQTGPSHLPEFTCSVTVGDKTYLGTGKRKKEAEENAAKQAVKDMKLYDPEED